MLVVFRDFPDTNNLQIIKIIKIPIKIPIEINDNQGYINL